MSSKSKRGRPKPNMIDPTCTGCGASTSPRWVLVIGATKPGHGPPDAWGRLLLCTQCQTTRADQAKAFTARLIDPLVMSAETTDGLPPKSMTEWDSGYYNPAVN